MRAEYDPGDLFNGSRILTEGDFSEAKLYSMTGCGILDLIKPGSSLLKAMAD